MKSSAHVYAVIMAGGRGERFWPLSTAARPKQFLTLFGGKPLVAQAVDRLAGFVPPERILIITSRELVPATREAVWNIPTANIIGEPMVRDTAAACALACGLVQRWDPDGVVCILTADQLMADAEGFRRTLADGAAVAAREDAVLTIGIQPTCPATGFGYIESGERLDTGTATEFLAARRFVEKPDAATAAAYVAGGRHLWNAGMFIWRVAVMRRALERHAPALLDLCQRVASAPAGRVEGVLDDVYPGLARISIDFAIMEKLDNIIMARGTFGWDDVGTWSAVGNHAPADGAGNIVVGACEALDAHGNAVVSEGRLTALLGVHDLVIVHAPQATLVCHRDRVQDLKKLVQQVARRPDGGTYV